MLNLTPKQSDQIWGEDVPYSEANLIIQERILDDFVSRIFIDVEVSINPLTYRFVKKHREYFADDQIIQQLLDHADYRGQSHGYVSSAFRAEYIDESVLLQAQEHLIYVRETVIKMHKFVTQNFDVGVN